MHLSECEMGKVVITEDLEVGHIVGFTYNLELYNISGLSNKELYDRTVPVVKFPKGERAIHHSNISRLTPKLQNDINIKKG